MTQAGAGNTQIVPTAKAAVAVSGAMGPTTTNDPSRIRLMLFPTAVIALVLVLLTGAGWALVDKYGERGSSSPNRAWIDTELTTEVLSVAKTNIEQLYTVDFTDFQQWQDAIRRTVDESLWPDTVDGQYTDEDLAQMQGMLTEASVDALGVKDIHDGMAQVAGFISFSSSMNGQQGVSGAQPIEVTLVERDGAWIITSFNTL